ncbi:MAG: hypothetical protein WC748_05445 [Legionellales bacterium]|jgi:hypothetical protein
MKLLKSQNSFGDERFTISVEEQNCIVTAQTLVSHVGEGEKVISHSDQDYLNCFFKNAAPIYKKSSTWLGTPNDIITLEFRTGDNDKNIKNLFAIQSLLQDPENGIKDKENLEAAKQIVNQELKKYTSEQKKPIEDSVKEKVKEAKDKYSVNHQPVVNKR